MTAKEAVKFVKSKRGIVQPNTGFTRQLEIYAKRYAKASHPRQENTFTRNIRKLKIGNGVSGRIRRLKAKGAEPVEAQEEDK